MKKVLLIVIIFAGVTLFSCEKSKETSVVAIETGLIVNADPDVWTSDHIYEAATSFTYVSMEGVDIYFTNDKINLSLKEDISCSRYISGSNKYSNGDTIFVELEHPQYFKISGLSSSTVKFL